MTICAPISGEVFTLFMWVVLKDIGRRVNVAFTLNLINLRLSLALYLNHKLQILALLMVSIVLLGL